MRYDLIGLLLLSSSVCAMDTMEWSFQTLQMIDMMQTIEITGYIQSLLNQYMGENNE